jgi:hypothetical protein
VSVPRAWRAASRDGGRLRRGAVTIHAIPLTNGAVRKHFRAADTGSDERLTLKDEGAIRWTVS